MSTIYNHRSLQPTGPPASGPSTQHSHARLGDSFEAIRQEFDILSSDLNVLRGQRDDFENKITSQVNELNIIRQALYELETQHGKVRSHYEEELARLRTELQVARQNIPVGTPHPAPAPTPIGPGGSGIPPPGAVLPPPGAGFSDPYYGRERGEREREPREREPRERERERLVERDRGDRDRDMRDREREKERDRSVDHRDPKRLKMDRDRDGDRRMKIDRPGAYFAFLDHFSPSLGPHNPPPKLPAPGPGLPPPPPAHGPYPPSTSSGPPGPPPPSSISEGPTLNDLALTTPGAAGAMAAASFLDDMDPANVPPEMKKDGSDWFAVFNPKVKRVLDVSLVHTLMHESVVCCVRFSADGKYLATGCNRAAQIYDTKTGSKVVVLIDKSASKTGDLYIRSVCFSPDGKYLATGAEDKKIRIWDIAAGTIRRVFDGHQQEIYSLDFSSDGRLIVSGSGDKTARIWNMESSSAEAKVLSISDPDSAHDAGVTSVAISTSGHLVAAGSLDAVVRIWDAQTGALLERLRGHRDSVYSVAFTPDGKGLVSGSLDKTLKYWDVSGLVAQVKAKKDVGGTVVGLAGGKKEGESQCTMNFTGHKDYVLSVAVSHDGQWVVSGSKDRGVQFWDSRTAIVQCMLQGHKNSVISIDLSPAGNVLATGSGDWQARIWSYTTM
ncbi:WD40 repeat-like protein [Athelia psychrophila]|uniref:WD40 repeat-like protein n=1 Tax=Athelia psychrophila TaxID=1759441 RepID=A0A166WKD6_9AGAM|nr:WD40 repeat-like protein [Fibularhizoctonia sp. CBS 109695]